MNLTRINISFLRDIPSNIKVDMRSSWTLHNFTGLNISELASFISSIKDNKTYLIIPILSDSKSSSELHLSNSFLINNRSNPDLIIRFVFQQWNESAFDLKANAEITFSFKLKRVFSSYF